MLRLNLRLELGKRLPFFCLATTKNTIFLASILQPFHVSFSTNDHSRKLVSLLLKNPSNRHATQQIHSHIVTTGLLHHYYFHHSASLYTLVFNTLLRCYSLGQFPHEAFILYKQSLHCHFPSSFDSFTHSFLIHACANLSSLSGGIQFHALTFKVGFHFHVYVQTALTNMYAVCGFLVDALSVFDEMPEKNSVTWNVMITGLTRWGELEIARFLFDQMPNRTVVSWTGIIDVYTRRNKPDEAVALFQRMVVCDGIQPTEITVLAILPAISNLGALEICQSIHAYGEKRGFNTSDIRIANSLVDSYAKCGCILSASRFFEEISSGRKNLVTWSSIISGFALHGLGNEAVQHFQMMEKAGLKPNRVTFLSVLNGCSHGGLVEEGLNFFDKMVGECEIAPDIKHYGCLVDMLGRIGRLEEAEKVALGIPNEIVNVVIWRTLLGACSFHGNVEMGERVTRKIMETERGYGGDYVLMSNIFASVGRYEDAEKLRSQLDRRKAFKVPGHSLF
ncbi:pentatricopeptide repeat-containing protein At1g09220, mitochondrial-like [Ziziphus jujuba]|uniref:Pentatricopeptide repeat-containing protein At1g09220, mitochondrial-like n=1 Tax=Ziziphus jujuba TaxID=326968 RepID=A0A6P4BSC5_ZIZJJ|nr:pentatricopeptide repeat-containing protein At1g09220, mitochondrial-like [Ziziphus jujuba]